MAAYVFLIGVICRQQLLGWQCRNLIQHQIRPKDTGCWSEVNRFGRTRSGMQMIRGFGSKLARKALMIRFESTVYRSTNRNQHIDHLQTAMNSNRSRIGGYGEREATAAGRKYRNSRTIAFKCEVFGEAGKQFLTIGNLQTVRHAAY
jgi:hypothetical protein